MKSQPTAPGSFDRVKVADQLRALGVSEGTVVVTHTSYRALRPIDGGPAAVIAALLDVLGPDGTLVMPCWTGSDDEPFDPACTPAASDLGVVAETFRSWPGVVRSNHPFAFAAHGPHAGHIVSDPLPLPPHVPESPIGRVHQLGGHVLLLGVQHDANTTLHLAELVAGVPYGVTKQCMILRDGQRVRVDYRENDHCCERFRMADHWLQSAGVQRMGPVGRGTARLIRSRDVVDEAVRRLTGDPLLFLHPRGSECEECDEARRSVALH